MRLILLVGVILILTIALVRGHTAPSSWLYPETCCGGHDCRPISCSTITTNPDGSSDWVGLHFAQSQTLISGDASCHVCISYPMHFRARHPHCIFLSPTM